MNRLEGKVALITGGAQGIGKAIAKRLASEGAAIALCDMNLAGATATAEELGNDGVKVKAFFMNVSDEEMVGVAVDEVMAEFGKIDILVNNAGITRDGLMIRMKKENWDLVLLVNLTGTFLVSKAVVKYMMKARAGSIVNIASVVGVKGHAGQANYSASKAGVIGLTKTMAKEFASRGITVNAIAPGYIQTEMTEHLSDEAKQSFMNDIPLNRPGTPEDVAGVAAFLSSPDGAYMTGQVLSIDGGMAI